MCLWFCPSGKIPAGAHGSTAQVLESKPKMRKIRTPGSFYEIRDERGLRTRSHSHTGSGNARSDSTRHMGVAWLKSGEGRNKEYGPLGDETKNLDIWGDENSDMVIQYSSLIVHQISIETHVNLMHNKWRILHIHKRLKNSHKMVKLSKNRTVCRATFRLNVLFQNLCRRRKEILAIFLHKRSRRALRKTIPRDFVSNFGRRGVDEFP